MPEFYASSPQVRCHFYTEKGSHVASSSFPDNRQGDQVVGVQTTKDLREAAGRFNITLTAERFYGVKESEFTATRAARTFAAQVAGAESLPFEAGSVGNNAVTWLDLLKPGDLVVIEMGPDRPQPTDSWYAKNWTTGLRGAAEVVMIGSIDEVRSTIGIDGSGKPNKGITVSGRDMGKYLVDDATDFNPWWDSVDALTGLIPLFTDIQNTQLKGTPANIINQFLKFWLFRKFDVEFDLRKPGGVQLTGDLKLSSILRQSLDTGTLALPDFQRWLQYEGSPWALFQQVQSAPWYVLQIDTRRGLDIGLLTNYTTDLVAEEGVVWNTSLSHFNTQVGLIYYRNPASNREYDDWTSLPTRVITDDDIIMANVGRSIEEVVTRWRVIPVALAQTRISGPQTDKPWEKELERRFGIRPRYLETPFIRDRLNNDTGERELASVLEKRVRDWDLHNLDYLNGTIQMKGMAQVRVGDRLWHKPPKGRGTDYYVEHVTQEFVPFQSWTTTVEVTRGQRHRYRGEKLFDAAGIPLLDPGAIGDLL